MKKRCLRGELIRAVNRWLWNEEKGAYYPYLLKEKRQEDFLMASTFMPLREKVAPKERANRLIGLLQSEEFGWNTFPVFSAAKSDKRFTVTEGAYQYNASWSGSVWILLNEGIVQGLKYYDFRLAAELACRTVREFDGSGQGVKRYAWTAALYITLIAETIFGITIDAARRVVRVRPLLCEALKQGLLSAENIALPDGGRLCVEIVNGKTKVEITSSAYVAE